MIGERTLYPLLHTFKLNMSLRYWLWLNEYQHIIILQQTKYVNRNQNIEFVAHRKREQLNWIRRLNSQQTATAITQELIIYMLQSSFGNSLWIYSFMGFSLQYMCIKKTGVYVYLVKTEYMYYISLHEKSWVQRIRM